MSTGVARLQLASPTDVVKALGDIGSHHWGMPEVGLVPYDDEGLDLLPRFTATEPLKEGDVYVDNINTLLARLFSTIAEQEEALARYKRLLGLARVARAISLLGYLPVKVRIPRLGGAMTYSPHGRLIFKGHYGPAAGSELDLFTFSMNYDVVGADEGLMPETLPQARLDAILARWKTFWVGGTGTLDWGHFTAETWLDEVSYSKIGPNGKTVNGQVQRAYSTPVKGGAVAGTQSTLKPFQVATVVTLDALGPRGGRFGRFYLPHLASKVVQGVYVNDQPAFAAAVVACLADVNDEMNTATEQTCELVVASARGEGENRPVRQVRVGNVPDTMRTRRNGLSETYQVVPFQSIP